MECLHCAIHNVRTASCRIGLHNGLHFSSACTQGRNFAADFHSFQGRWNFISTFYCSFLPVSRQNPLSRSLSLTLSRSLSLALSLYPALSHSRSRSLSLNLPVSRHLLITEHFPASEMSDRSFSHLHVVPRTASC